MIRWVTLILILINIIFFVVEPKAGGFRIDVTDSFNQQFQFTPAFAFDRPWIFVTSTFMHADLTHLAFNMFVLFLFGSLLESKLGTLRFIGLYFAAGIVGNFLSLAMAFSGVFPITGGTIDPMFIPGVGASGAIMGVLGVLGLITPRVPIFVMFIPVAVPMYIGVILFAIFNIAISFIPSSIGTGAHLGGLALGVLYGLWLKHKYQRRRMVRISYDY